MKALANQLVIITLLTSAIAANGQLSLESYTTSQGGGSISGGNLSGEVVIGSLSGTPSSTTFSSYVGLLAANLETAAITIRSEDGSENLIADEVNGYLLKITPTGSYDTLESKLSVSSEFSFSTVFTGTYLVNVSGDPESYIPTYNGNVILWEEAEQIILKNDSTISINIEGVPEELAPTENGGVISGTIETEVVTPGGRVLQTSPDAGRSCGLRTDQNGTLELVALTETDANGFFEFTNLPSATYEFFIDVPGVPFEQAASTTINLEAEVGVSSEYQVEAVITETGIQVEIEQVLGFLDAEEIGLKVYPNPASSLLTLSFSKLQKENHEIEMRDVMGRLIFYSQLNANEMSKQIPVSHLMRGSYFIKISNASSKDRITYKVILK